MARFNEILAGRLNRALQKFTGIKASAPTPQLATEIIPVLSMFWGAENRYLESWNRFATFQTAAAVAAQFSFLKFRNPVGSGIIAVFEKMFCFNANAAAVEMALSGPALATSGAADGSALAAGSILRLDPRGNPSTNLILTNGANGTGSNMFSIWAATLAANTGFGEVIVTDIQEITLLPGDAMFIASLAANTILSAGATWRERALEDSEKF